MTMAMLAPLSNMFPYQCMLQDYKYNFSSCWCCKLSIIASITMSNPNPEIVRLLKQADTNTEQSNGEGLVTIIEKVLSQLKD